MKRLGSGGGVIVGTDGERGTPTTTKTGDKASIPQAADDQQKNDNKNGDIYEMTDSGDIGDVIGEFKDGKEKFF